MCILLACFGDVFQINMVNGDSHDMDIKLKGVGGLYKHEDALIITYL
jgi:hypothetical protein